MSPTELLDIADKLPDGAFLFANLSGQYACGWNHSDVLRRGLWFESADVARMSWEMSDKDVVFVPIKTRYAAGFTDWRGIFGGFDV